MKRLISSALAVPFFVMSIAHAETFKAPGVDQLQAARQQAANMSPGEAINLRLQILGAKLALIEMKKSKWLADVTGANGTGGYSLTIGYASELVQILGLMGAVALADKPTQKLLYPRVANFVDQQTAAITKVGEIQTELEGLLRGKTIDMEKSTALLGQLSKAKGDLEAIESLRPLIYQGPQRALRLTRNVIALGAIGVIFIDASVSSVTIGTIPYAQVTDAIDNLNQFIDQSEATLKAYDQRQ